MRTGINDKMILYCRRYSNPSNGSYFEYRLNKEVCNPEDPKRGHFYMKIGGIVFLPKKLTPGKRRRYSCERMKESEYFGSYVFFGDTDRKLRTILYARRKGLPQNKLVSIPGTLHNVIPRYDGREPGVVIIGMRICHNIGGPNAKCDRRWTRFDGPFFQFIILSFANNWGFYEINDKQDLNEINSTFTRSPQQRRQRPDNPIVGIYVSKNTSALMVDATAQHLHNDLNRDYVYTLFQEGAFICTNCPINYCLYDEEESDDYDLKRLLAEKRHLFTYPTIDLEVLLNRSNESNKNIIIFLKSVPNYTFWTIRVTKSHTRATSQELQICVPTGGQFDKILEWSRGIEEVIERQSLKPWNKYIESDFQIYNKSNPILSDIDLNRDGVYPQMP